MSKDNKQITGKRRMGTLPWLAIEEVVKVTEHGTDKYGAHNYLNAEGRMAYWEAMQRHMLAWVRGEDYDPDSGCKHIAHAVAGGLMLLSMEQIGVKDDRALIAPPSPIDPRAPSEGPYPNPLLPRTVR